MDKSEFTKALEYNLRSRLLRDEKFWQEEIRRQKEMKDRPSWIAWLKQQRDEAVEIEEGVMNGPDKYYSRESPTDNAQIFANLVEFDTLTYNPETEQWGKGTVDWRQLWDSALPFLSNLKKRQAFKWRWRVNFTFMLKVMDSALKAKVFTRQINSILDKEQFTQFLSEVLARIPENIAFGINEKLDKLRDNATDEGFRNRLRVEEEKWLNDPALLYKALHPHALAMGIAELYDTPERDWNAAWGEVLSLTNTNPLIKGYCARLTAEIWLSKIKQILDAPKPTAVAKKSDKLTQKQLAIFYRTLQHLEAYPEFGQDGRIREDHYREIGPRHGVSPGNFKKHYLENSAKKSVGELAQIIPINQLEELANLLPNPEKLRDLLKVENAKTIKK